jgi:hypothetical protein
MTAAQHPLDPFLPLLAVERPAVLNGVALMEVETLAQLVELCRNPRVCRFLLARLSDTVALIDADADQLLVEALREAGHTPRTAEGMEP